MPAGHDPDHIRSHLAYRNEHGLTWAPLSEHSGIPRNTLTSWAWRLSSRRRPAFTEVEVHEELVDSDSAPLVLELQTGHRIHVPNCFDEAALRRLLQVLGC